MSDVSLLPLLTDEDLVILCRHFDELARMYWDRSWRMGEPTNIVVHCQREASRYYASARQIRGESLRRNHYTAE